MVRMRWEMWRRGVRVVIVDGGVFYRYGMMDDDVASRVVEQVRASCFTRLWYEMGRFAEALPRLPISDGISPQCSFPLSASSCAQDFTLSTPQTHRQWCHFT